MLCHARYFNSTDNPLQYWGLDYPPLTALVSCGFGRAAQAVVPELVERRLVKVEAERRRLADEEKQLSALLDAARVTRRS